MFEEVVQAVEREVLRWDGMQRVAREDEVALYHLGRRHIGHIHEDNVADVTLPKAIYETVLSEGMAEPHRGGFRSVVSFYIHSMDDVPAVIELFRASYDAARASAERRASAQTT